MIPAMSLADELIFDAKFGYAENSVPIKLLSFIIPGNGIYKIIPLPILVKCHFIFLSIFLFCLP